MALSLRTCATCAVLVPMLLAQAPAPARAQTTTATATMAVTATVLKLCLVTATPLAFGNYSPAAALDGQAELVVTCTASTPYTVALNLGTATGTTARQMTGLVLGSSLNYVLYQNAARTTLWGETAGTDTVAGTGNGLPQTLTVYGRVPANQRPSPGLYTDLVTVTLTY